MMAAYLRKLWQMLLNRYRSIIFAGKEVECLICGWKGKRFFEHAKCPSCGSFARTRLIAWAIDYFQVPLTNSRVLHVAPNYPEFTYMNMHVNDGLYDRIDINSRKKFINLVGDVTNLSLPDEKYDLVIMWHVMEHIPNDRLAIQEIRRVLKKKGRLLLSVPIYPLYREKTFEDPSIPRSRFEEVHGHPDHCRSCGLDYYLRFEDLGFSTRTLMCKHVAPEARTKYGLNKGHIVWLFEK